MLALHRDQQSTERLKLAKHRKKSNDFPSKYLSLVIDGMDQKKTVLPHWPRPPKNVDETCLIQLHCVGCLIFNGPLRARVFFNYPNLHNDGNLVITIIQMVLNDWSGPLPPVLYLQLDNTARENKNNLLMSYLNFLVFKKVFKKIKIGFLMVGHTHDQIDQMFSRFSKKLSRNKAFTYESLTSLIKDSYDPKPEVTLLTETVDFRRFALSDPKITVDHSMHNISFPHQYKIEMSNSDVVPRQWGKKFSTSPAWKPDEGVKLLKADMPIKTIWSSPGMSLRRKGDRRIDDATVDNGARQPTFSEMEKFLLEIEKGVMFCSRYFKDEETEFWVEFFSQQREFNSVLMVEDKSLVNPFLVPGVAVREEADADAHGLHESPAETDEVEILNRVYGDDREIYVGPYRKQSLIEREKENMDGDYSDLLKNTFIAVVADGCPHGREFWIAKVEEVICERDCQIPSSLSILWYAAKEHEDQWTGRYYQEIETYERRRSRKGKSGNQPVLKRDNVVVKDTCILSYNFYLKKNCRLYKATVDRVKFKLQEFRNDERSESSGRRISEAGAGPSRIFSESDSDSDS